MAEACRRCGIVDKELSAEGWVCCRCGAQVHSYCAKHETNIALKGDRLFTFECRNCSYEKSDELKRSKLTWLQIIHLVLYNLTVSTSGRQGYFRWREDICGMIDQHWSYLIPDRGKTSTWRSTVAGTLSVHCPKVFKSGVNVFKESGWWALTEVKAPTAVTEEEQVRSKPSRKGKASSDLLLITSAPVDSASRESDAVKYGRGKRQRKEKKLDDEFVPKVSRCESGNSHLTKKISPEVPSVACLRSAPSPASASSSSESWSDSTQTPSVKEEASDLQFRSVEESVRDTQTKSRFSRACANELESCDDGFSIKTEDADLVQLFKDNPCFSGMGTDVMSEMEMEVGGDFDYSNDPFAVSSLAEIIDFAENAKPQCGADGPQDFLQAEEGALHGVEHVDSQGASLCSQDSSQSSTDTGILSKVAGDAVNKSKIKGKSLLDALPELRALTSREELDLLLKLKMLPNTLESDPVCRRLHRKLSLRKLKREMGLPLFDLDEVVRKAIRSSAPESVRFLFDDDGRVDKTDVEADRCATDAKSYRHPALRGVQVLDRFHFLRQGPKVVHEAVPRSFMSRLMGGDDDLRSITSPYTSRVLKPYIRRDFETVPRKLKLFQELYAKLCIDVRSQRRYPIDYCYVQPDHLPAVNAMCCEFFWPGINLTECLQYPEFSCVVLYRKILIGFAFMVPDVKVNEAYISFILVHPDWRGSGIGTFMIYHLIQTCMGKDITLHVSPSNPSMMVYQKFGFKAEELILNFYDRYLPDDSPECKHALLLRLQR